MFKDIIEIAKLPLHKQYGLCKNNRDFIFYVIPGLFGFKINMKGTVVNLIDEIVCEISYTQEYCTVSIKKEGKYKTALLHRLLALTFIPIPDYGNVEDYDVNHIDSDKHNFNLDNLEWASRKENMIHALKAGKISVADKIIQRSTGNIFFSIEHASWETGISHETIRQRLLFKHNSDEDFIYEDHRITPKTLGISKTKLGGFKKDGKLIEGVESLSTLYRLFPEISRTRNSGKKRKYLVEDLTTGERQTFTSQREFENCTGISRRYINKWLDQNDGRYKSKNYLVIDKGPCN